MRYVYSRTATVLTSLAIIAGVASIAPLASAAVGGPTVVLSTVSATTTNAASIPITVAFSESVGAFATSSITTTNSVVSALTGSGSNYSFNLIPTVSGAVMVQFGSDIATSTASSTGNQASNILEFTSDTVVPGISSVTVSTTTTGATVSWNTSETTNGQVLYGTSTTYTASSTLAAAFTTAHTAQLTGLATGTTYHFQVRSMDVAGNLATTSDATFTTAAAPAAPQIQTVAANATGTSTASVTWSTDIPATSQVFYGTSASYGSASVLNALASTTHAVSLSGLTEAVLYHYIVVSTNAAGTATSSDQVFTSGSTASTTPLAVTGIDAVRSTATADGTFASGFKWVIDFVVPSNETAFQLKFSDFVNATPPGTIPIAGNVRYYSEQSSNATSSTTAIVETNNDYGVALMLTGDTSVSTPGRQIDVTIEAAVPSGTPTGVYSTFFGARSL